MAYASIDHSDFRASLWTILYCLLVVVGCGSQIDPGVSYFVAVPAGLFIGSQLTSLSFLIRLRSAPARMRDASGWCETKKPVTGFLFPLKCAIQP